MWVGVGGCAGVFCKDSSLYLNSSAPCHVLPQTSTHLSERIQKNLGSYKDVVEVLGHKDAVDVYGADRLPETPISGSSAENHFERCFDSALLSSSLRDTERNKPSPLVASGAKMSSRPAPHKGEYSEGNSRGQSTSPSHGPASLTSSAGKAKHRSRPPGYEDRHKASRENPLFFQRKAQPSAAPPDRSSMDERHTTGTCASWICHHITSCDLCDIT